MSEHNPYRIFVTHAWQVDADYERLFEYLGENEFFFYRNTSNPEAEAPTDRTELRDRLAAEIRPAECAVVLAGLHDIDAELVELQAAMAKTLGKPIVLIERFGSVAVPEVLKEKADELVGWSTRLIIDAIRRQARHEDTTIIEVIEWDP